MIQILRDGGRRGQQQKTKRIAGLDETKKPRAKRDFLCPALKAGGDGGNFIRKKELHHNEQINVAET